MMIDYANLGRLSFGRLICGILFLLGGIVALVLAALLLNQWLQLYRFGWGFFAIRFFGIAVSETFGGAVLALGGLSIIAVGARLLYTVRRPIRWLERLISHLRRVTIG